VKTEGKAGSAEALQKGFSRFLDAFANKYGLRPDAINKAVEVGAKPPFPVPSFSGRERNVLFRNQGNGSFVNIADAAGAGCIEDSRGMAFLDADGDGDLDIALHNFFRRPAQFLRNDAPRVKSPLVVRLRGTKSNTRGIGARVTVDGLAQTVLCGSGYLSQSTTDLHFAVTGKVKIRVRWPSGAVQEVEGDAETRVTITEGGKAESAPLRKQELRDAVKPAAAMRAGDEIPTLPGPRRVVGLWSGRCELCRGELAEWAKTKAEIEWLCIDRDTAAAAKMIEALKIDLKIRPLDDAVRAALGDVATPTFLGMEGGKVVAKFASDRALEDALRWRGR
jgi:hypothetical protein